MKNNKPIGIWKNYYPSGIIKSEGYRSHFLLDSVWKFYNEKGILTDVINYKAGKKNGLTEKLNQEGFLIRTENYENNKLNGLAHIYYKIGQIKMDIPYIDNKEEGRGYEYDKEGIIISLIDYKNGVKRKQEKINRKNAAKKRNGVWKWFYDNKSLKEEGRYVNGLKNGYFRLYDRKGKLLSTTKYIKGEVVIDADELVNLEIKTNYYSNAQPKKIATYNLKGKQEGIERNFDEKGEIKSSKIYDNGVLLGEGIVDKKGIKQGSWKEYYFDGTLRAKGKYLNGLKIGPWRFYHPNGNLEQKGTFLKKEKPHGPWIWKYDTGVVEREENFRNGLEDGMMIEYNDTGKVITKGEYIDGEKEGEWFYEIGDNREKGNYQVNQKYGVWKAYYVSNNKLSFEGNYIDGTEDGKHIYYYINGRKRIVGKYEMGVKQGDWQHFNEEGGLISVITYEDGIEKKVDGLKIKSVSVEELIPEQ